MDESKPKEECKQVKYNFKCTECGMNEEVHYKGVSPPFSRKIQLKYPSYVMKDPFSPPGKGEILILGADCAICDKAVCVSKECSIFYLKTYCLKCVQNSMDKFPKEVINKVTKS